MEEVVLKAKLQQDSKILFVWDQPDCCNLTNLLSAVDTIKDSVNSYLTELIQTEKSSQNTEQTTVYKDSKSNECKEDELEDEVEDPLTEVIKEIANTKNSTRNDRRKNSCTDQPKRKKI